MWLHRVVGGRQHNPGETWNFNVPAETRGGRVWGRMGCKFNNNSRTCQTGDYGDALACTLSEKLPLTLAEVTISNGQDFYDISIIDSFKVQLLFSYSNTPNLMCCADKCVHDQIWQG
jgi:hypothetical protein